MYKLKINGKSYDEVQGTRDWSKTIERNFNDRIFRTKGNFQFTGWGELFDLIFSNLNYNGVCESLNARIYFRESKVDAYAEWWRGEIKMQDGQWDLLKDKVETQVLDDVWAAKFANSEDQKVFLRSSTAKKGGVIAPCPSELCDFYDPLTGNFDYANRKCYRIFDVLTFLVDYHTEGKCSFASDYFDTGDGDRYYITDKHELNYGDGSANPEVSFSEVFDELNKKFCLWIIIETDDFDNPVLRIEPQSYVFEDTKAVEIVDPEGIVLKVDLDQLYTIIEVGSTAKDFDDTDDSNFYNARFYAWNDESYNTPGDCEFENNTLNLVSDWTIDHNSIEHILKDATDAYDDDRNIVLVEINSYLDAFQFDFDDIAYGSLLYYYNFNLTNAQVIINWFDGIPQQILKYITGEYIKVEDPPDTLLVGGSGWAYNTSAGGSDAFAFVTEISDVNDSYSITLDGGYKSGNFEPKTNAFYNFDGFVNVDTATGSSVITLQPYIRVYEDTTWAKMLVEYPQTLVSYGFNGRINIVDQVWIPATGVARVEMDSGSTGLVYFNECEMVVRAADVLYGTANDAPLIYEYDIQRFKLSLADFNTLDNNLGYIRFIDTKKDVRYDVWATELKYNPLSQMVEVGKFIGKPLPVDSVCIWLLEDGAWDDSGCWDDSDEWIDPDLYWFIITVKTDNAGTSAADEFLIPTSGAGTYDYIVDWGDGVVETGLTGGKLHTYSSSGTYTVKIAGTFPRIFFNNGGDKLKLLTIEQWGELEWESMNAAFYGCTNLTGNYVDAPDLANATSLREMFRDCTNFNSPVQAFPVSTITDMVSMFRNCSSFDQTLGDWEVTSLASGQNFMNGAGISIANYDDTLAGWTGWDGVGPTKSVVNGTIIGFGSSQYTIATSQAIKDYLINDESWFIADGGGV